METELYQFFKTYNTLLAYNKDIQNQFNKEAKAVELFNNILKDSSTFVEKEKIVAMFLVFVNNSIMDTDSDIKSTYFRCFFIERFDDFKFIIFENIKSLKVQKLILGIAYTLYFTNVKNIKQLNDDILKFIFEILSFINIKTSCKESNEISDWVHIIINYIINNEEDFSYLTLSSNCKSKYLFEIIYDFLFQNAKEEYLSIVMLEYIRDIIDLQKESKELVLYSNFAVKILDILKISLEKTYENIVKWKSKNFEPSITYSSISSEYTYDYKRLLLLSDILAVIMTYDQFIQEFISESQNKLKAKYFDKEICYSICENIVKLLQISDVFYLKFNNLKGSKNADDNAKLDFDHVLYSFQTNLFKILSNFSYKNNVIKEYFLIKKEEFYYILNHFKNDNCNPFKREWSILLMKSLTENCSIIQEMIEQLKPCEIDLFVKDYLLKKGYDISIEKGFSKPIIKKIENN